MAAQPSMLSFIPNKRLEIAIYVDTREASTRNGQRIISILTEQGIEARRRKLDFGDYLIGEDVAVERKTVMDLVGTLTNRFLFDQLFKMREAYPKSLLLVEGYMGVLRKVSRVRPESINGALFMIANSGMPIVPTIDLKDTALFLSTAAKQLQKENRVLTVRHREKTKDTRSQQIFAVAGLPHIGPVLAVALLNRFRTVKRVYNASPSELQEVNGIGPKRARDVTNILEAEFAQKEEGD